MEQAATTVFNPTQIQLLRMFAIDSSQESLDELKEVLSILLKKDEAAFK